MPEQASPCPGHHQRADLPFIHNAHGFDHLMRCINGDNLSAFIFQNCLYCHEPVLSPLACGRVTRFASQTSRIGSYLRFFQSP
jgi:hypothetical protein